MKHSHFPLFLPTQGKTVLVVGGGNIATRRVTTLLSFQFDIIVVSLTASDTLITYQQEEKISLFLRTATNTDFSGIDFCLLCTNQPKVNEFWGSYCKSLGILSNQCHDKSLCDFYFPAIVTEEEQVIALTGNGNSHKKVANLKKILEKEKKRL